MAASRTATGRHDQVPKGCYVNSRGHQPTGTRPQTSATLSGSNNPRVSRFRGFHLRLFTSGPPFGAEACARQERQLGVVSSGPPQRSTEVAQTSKSAVSWVSKPANRARPRKPCRFGNRRYSRFGNLRYTEALPRHKAYASCENFVNGVRKNHKLMQVRFRNLLRASQLRPCQTLNRAYDSTTIWAW